jgi:hypothetical protein
MEDSIPPEVREFVLRHIDSVAQLEALLLMRRNPAERWDAMKIARRVYTTEAEAVELLTRLAADGCLKVADNGYWYECPDAAQREIVDRLAVSHARHLIAVTNLIHSKPRRIRQFADAFKFRKDR